MPTPPARNDISGSGATPSNAQARAGFGALWDYVTALLGLTGTAADARKALGFGSAAAASDRNLVDNSRFKINQRVKSGTVTLAAGAYGHDRWKAGAAGCTYTFAASGNDVVVTITAGSLLQVILADDVDGGTYCMSWFGTAQGKINGGSYASTGVVATGVTASANFQIEFGTGTLSRVQVEPGDSPTTYEARKKQADLDMCQRVLCKSYQQSVAPGAATGVNNGGEDTGFFGLTPNASLVNVRFPRMMTSAAPTIAVYDANGVTNTVTTFTGAGVQQNNQTVTVDNLSERGFKAFVSVNSPARIFLQFAASTEP